MRWMYVGLLGAVVACGAQAPISMRVAMMTPGLGAAAGTPPVPAPAPVPVNVPVDVPVPVDGHVHDHATSCPPPSVWIPPTPPDGFIMGKGFRGAHRVTLTHGFCMDSGEVSVREFARCVEEGACKEPWPSDPYSMYPSKLDYPVNLVSWTKARAYCAWAGERLPTEAEWEWAATGPDQTTYPWGNEPEPSCDYVDYTRLGAPKWAAGADVGCGGGGPSPVGSHPKGDKVWPGGAIHDLAGNVWEWVEDSFGPYSAEPQTDPVRRLEMPEHAIRGGGWNRSYAAMVVTYRGAAHYTYQVPALGFRCVQGAPLASPSPAYD